MESLTRRVAGWPAWRRWGLLLAMIALSWGALLLAIRTSSLPLRLLGVLVVIATMPLMSYAGRTVACEGGDAMRREDRRYIREFTPGMAAYFLIMLFVWPLHKEADPLWLKGVIALTPAIPVALVIVAMVRYVLASDEFMQRLHLQALAVAAGLVGFGSMAIGFLAASQVWAVDGATSLLLVFPALCLTYGVALFWCKRRYRS